MKDKLDFIIIGAQKAGTTSLFHYLSQHPQVWMPPGKEEPFFSDDYPAIPYRSWDEYLSKVFGSAPDEVNWGTATPHYMTGAILRPDQSGRHPNPVREIPERIQRVMPDVRLIAILREPVSRAISAHRMETVLGAETRTFDDAISELLTPEALERARESPEETSNYVVLGEYARILQGYLDVFSRDQLLVVFTEDLEREPARVLSEIFRHIRVDPAFVPPNIGTRYLALSGRDRFPWLRPREWERTAAGSRPLAAVWRRIPFEVRTEILRRYWRWSQHLSFWNAANRDGQRRAPACSPHTRGALEGHYASHLAELHELLERDLPDSWCRPVAV